MVPAAAAFYFSKQHITQKNQTLYRYNKMVKLNTAVQIGCFQHISDLDTMKNNKMF